MFLHRSDQPMNIHASQGIRLREAFDRCRGGWAFLWWVSPYPLRLSGAALRGRIWWSLEKGTRTCDIGTGFQVDFGDQGFLPIQNIYIYIYMYMYMYMYMSRYIRISPRNMRLLSQKQWCVDSCDKGHNWQMRWADTVPNSASMVFRVDQSSTKQKWMDDSSVLW